LSAENRSRLQVLESEYGSLKQAAEEQTAKEYALLERAKALNSFLELKESDEEYLSQMGKYSEFQLERLAEFDRETEVVLE